MEQQNFLDVTVFAMNSGQWQALAPYLGLSAGIFLATLAAGFRLSAPALRILSWLILLPFVGMLAYDLRAPAQAIFGTSIEVNSLTRMVGLLCGVLAAISSLFSRSSEDGDHPEWLPLKLIMLLGLSLLPAARDWVAFFVALETVSIPAFILAALDTNRERSLQAGLKYLMIGAFASAIFLFGVTLLYGVSGSFDFAKIHEIAVSASPVGRSILIAGFLLVTVGLGFKVALAPFHMWAPDVYQAAPTGIAAYLATASKVSVFAAAMTGLSYSGALDLLEIKATWHVLAILSIVVGNLVAVAQTKVRRMFAYSGIANAGYAALAVAAGTQAAPALLISLAVYSVSLIGVFAVIEGLSQKGGRPMHEDVAIEELPGLFAEAPALYTVIFTLCVFSIAGLPPLPGFLGKYLLLKEAWAANLTAGSIALIVGTVLGLAYYLRILVPLLIGPQEGVARIRRGQLSVATLLASSLAGVVMLAVLLGFSRLNSWMDLVAAR